MCLCGQFDKQRRVWAWGEPVACPEAELQLGWRATSVKSNKSEYSRIGKAQSIDSVSDDVLIWGAFLW